MNRFLFLTFASLVMAVPLFAANNFCMDCTQKAEVVGSGEDEDVKITATCCTAWDGLCFAGDILIDTDVGADCRVSEPSQESGSTYCRSDQTFDKNCPTSGGGGGGTRTADGGGTACMYDANGWCDASCSRCTWG